MKRRSFFTLLLGILCFWKKPPCIPPQVAVNRFFTENYARSRPSSRDLNLRSLGLQASDFEVANLKWADEETKNFMERVGLTRENMLKAWGQELS